MITCEAAIGNSSLGGSGTPADKKPAVAKAADQPLPSARGKAENVNDISIAAIYGSALLRAGSETRDYVRIMLTHLNTEEGIEVEKMLRRDLERLGFWERAVDWVGTPALLAWVIAEPIITNLTLPFISDKFISGTILDAAGIGLYVAAQTLVGRMAYAVRIQIGRALDAFTQERSPEH